MRTKAAVVCEYNTPALVETLKLEKPQVNEVTVRMVAAGVCHSDLSVMDGTLYYDLPIVLGHEGAGIVEKIGPGVSRVRPGDHVIMSFVSEGGHLLDDTCRFYSQEGVPVQQMARIGAMSQYTVVPEQSVIKINKRYPLEQMALVGCSIATGAGAVLNTAYGSAIPHLDMPKILTLYDKGKLKIDRLVTTKYTLAQVNDALNDLRAGKKGRGLIVF